MKNITKTVLVATILAASQDNFAAGHNDLSATAKQPGSKTQNYSFKYCKPDQALKILVDTSRNNAKSKKKALNTLSSYETALDSVLKHKSTINFVKTHYESEEKNMAKQWIFSQCLTQPPVMDVALIEPCYSQKYSVKIQAQNL